ncbi:protein of unknown function [Streptococcus thermophilus]|uniref:Uncharacterized protein n=1 Tax=Streptococcus thermophilus TaxID=1308 RepID=A0A8D6U4F5_STRTR|nr:protein of unknown function [Streptococcus thermophilus]
MNISFLELRKVILCVKSVVGKICLRLSQSALKEIRDSIGIRIVYGFVDYVYKIINVIKVIPGVSI